MGLKSRKNRRRTESAARRFRFEQLESRRVLATVLDLNPATPAPSQFAYTDNNGDVITVRLTGNAGRATITSNDAVTVNAGNLDNGEQISSIAITGASSNFVISFSVNSTAGDGIVALGNVTSNSTIRSLVTVPDTTGGNPTSDFRLGSYRGPGFSTNGGLTVTNVLGDAGGVAIILNSGLAAQTSINVGGSLTGDVSLMRSGLLGTIRVGGNVLEDGDGSLWSIAGATPRSGAISVAGDFASDVRFAGQFSGNATLGGSATGEWSFNAGVAGVARLEADDWADVEVRGAFNGSLLASNGDVTAVVNGDLQSRAVITASDDVSLDVRGGVVAGAVVTAGNDIDLTVVRTFSGQAQAGDDITLDLGPISRALLSGTDISGSVAGSIQNSRLIAASVAINLDVTGSISGTTFSSGQGISLDLTGSVSNSSFDAGDDVTIDISGSATNTSFQSSESDLDVSIGGNYTGGRVSSGSEDVTLRVGGNLSGVTISSLESSVSLDVGGNVSNVRVAAEDELTLDLNGAVSGSTFVANDDLTVDVTGDVSGSQFTSTDSSVTMSVSGSIAGSVIEAASDLSLSVSGNISTSTIFNDESGSVVLDLLGDLIDSLVESGSSDVTADIGGDVVNSRIIVPEDGLFLTLAGSLRNSELVANSSDLSATIGGSVVGSTIFAEDDLDLSVAGSFIDSSVTSLSEDIEASVGGNFTGSTAIAENDLTLSVAGNVAHGAGPNGAPVRIVSNEFDVVLTVGGAMPSGEVIGADVTATIQQNFGGNITAERLDLVVNGSVTQDGTIRTLAVRDLNADVGLIGFAVAGRFDGVLEVNGTFASGTGATQTLVGGVVGSNAKLTIGSFDAASSATQLRFGGVFAGELNLGGALTVDLLFDANVVGPIIIGGSVLADIDVNGSLASLVSSSLFVAANANDGDFVDGGGTVTGTLDTVSGHGNVSPRA